MVSTRCGRLRLAHADDPAQLEKVLLLSKFTFAEKYEKVFGLLYYRLHMLLMVEFPDEQSAERFLRRFRKHVNYYRHKSLPKVSTVVCGDRQARSQLRFLVKFSREYKFCFAVSDLLKSHDRVRPADLGLFGFGLSRNPAKVAQAQPVAPKGVNFIFDFFTSKSESTPAEAEIRDHANPEFAELIAHKSFDSNHGDGTRTLLTHRRCKACAQRSRVSVPVGRRR